MTKKSYDEKAVNAIGEKLRDKIGNINDIQLGHIAEACELDGSMSQERMEMFIIGIGCFLGIPEAYTNRYLNARYSGDKNEK